MMTRISDTMDAQACHQTAEYLRGEALRHGWSVSDLRSPVVGCWEFIATDIPGGVVVQTEVSTSGGLRSWRMENRTQAKASDAVVSWFERKR